MTVGRRTHPRRSMFPSGPNAQRVVLGAIAIGALVLSGCTAPEDNLEPVDTPTVSTSEPTEEPTAPSAPDDVLFTLSAKVRATNGTTITIGLIAHEPRAWNDPEISALADQFVQRCATGNGITPIDEAYLTAQGASLMYVEFTSDSPDHQFESPLELYFGNVYFARAAFTDAVVTAGGNTDCYEGATWLFTNNAYGVASFETGSATPDTSQWQFGSYGFQVLPGVNASIESCVKVITPLGADSGVESVSGWDVSRHDGDKACGIGYIGE